MEDIVGTFVRPLNPETDLEGVLQLLNAVRLADGNGQAPTADQMRAAFASPGFHRWLAFDRSEPERSIGYGVLYHQTTERCYGDAQVHPLWRRRGVGRVLVEQLVEQAAALGTRYLTIDVAATHQEALRFLLSQGFRYRGNVWALVLPPEVELPAPQWPRGYRVTTLAEVDDLPLFVDLCHRTFADLWGHWENTPGMVTVERMAEWLAASDLTGVFIVLNAIGEAVGQCRTFLAAATAPADVPHTLDQPGVVLEHRDVGLARPLALAAAGWLRDRSIRPVRLESWGDTAETIAGYEALGFRLVRHEVSYVREVGG